MKKIPLFNDRGFAIVDNDDYDWLSEYRWTLSTIGYAVRADSDGGNVYMHREILGLSKGDGKIVDHINHDTLDNRKENLRICTKQQNQLNQKAKKRKNGSSSSKYKGVSKRSTKSVRPWRCRIVKDGEEITKYFETEVEAAREYNKLAIELHGDFAYINEINETDNDLGETS